MRNTLSPQKRDLDKSVTHLTEAVLLQFQPSRDVVYTLFLLASALSSRFMLHYQPDDIKSSVKYFRFLRTNFHPLEAQAFDIPHGQLTSRLVRALAYSLLSGSDDVIQDMEEMVALTHELLCSDISTSDLINVVIPFSDAVAETLRLDDANQPLDQVIQVLREAMVLSPDTQVSSAIAWCLAARFQMGHVINDYEEAMAIADKIVGEHSPGDSLTRTQRKAIQLIQVLVASRLNTYSSPEYLEDAIHRFRTLLCLPSLPDQDRTSLVDALNDYARQRFWYFGGTGDSGNTPSTVHFTYFVSQGPGGSPEDDPALASNIRDNLVYLKEILTAIQNDERTDVEAAVEQSRTLLSLQHSSHPMSCLPAIEFAHILFQAYQRTTRLDYLNEAITAYRDLRETSAPKMLHYLAGDQLLRSLAARWKLFHLGRDFEELMQLFPELANDGSGEVFQRFKISHGWACAARVHAHPSISTAYETTMSLMQETLFFSPTLQIQHFRLARTLKGYEGLSSDYASYLIEKGQFKQAIETLERGRSLLWSEMRGLRTSTDQLRAVNPALADKLADINWRLESATMSVTRGESQELGDSGTETRRREEMDSIGHSVTTQRRLLEERNTLISHIQSFPGFENFLKPPSFDALNSSAAHGPVIIINQSQFSSYIILLLKDSPPFVISAPSHFHDRANRLKDDLLRVRKEKGLDSKDYDVTLASVLADLYELVGRPVIERLRQLEVPEKSRVWWCPTDAFCSLPLHAMGPIPSDDRDGVYFMDLYITSYTPTLSALIESRKPGLQPKTPDKPSLLLVAQPETLPGAWGEINVLQAVGAPVTTLVSQKATPTTVVASLREHRFVHFVCHGLLEIGKPFDASFELHGDNLTLLEIVRSRLPAADFAFLSACHTAELTEDSIADEGLHLAAAMQFCGFRSVIGTMWAMADTDGADLSKHFYKPIFSESTGRRRVPYYERSARVLQSAVKKLRKKRGITLERWVNFVHYGA
jgi:tetratricopeptide (TPR) repeat protein